MALVTDPASTPPPGERRLDRPPSDRYRETAPTPAAGADVDGDASPARGIAFGVLAGLAGMVATIVLGGPMALSAGLLVVAVATGWAVGTALKTGAGGGLARPTGPWLAVAIALGAVVLGQVGLWLYARTEGGVLTLPEYLADTWGILVPIQAVLAAAGAWWTAR